MATPEEALATQIRNIETMTGKSMAEWTEIVRKSGKTKHAEVLALLKANHGMSHGQANRVSIVAREAISGVAPVKTKDPGAVTDALYAGDKAKLRPIHDALLKALATFGGDIEHAPKKGYVSLRRKKQFALIQPGLAWVNLGLVVKDEPVTARFESSATFNPMFTHRVRVRAPKDVDAELKAWMRRAYDASL